METDHLLLLTLYPDTLIGTLTVEEMLMYTAYLKRPVSEGRDSKQRAVDELLEQLGLQGCKDVKIGDNMSKGISGGQVRHLSVKLVSLCDSFKV